MSKTPGRRRPHGRNRHKPLDKKAALSVLDSSEKQEKIKRIAIFVTILILAAIPFALSKYFEFNSPGPFDSGAYVYSAKHILDGAQIGVEEMPSARLGTLLINILGVKLSGFNETGVKWIQGILQAAALILMFYTMLRLYGVLPAAVGVVVASVYLSAPIIAKFGNVKEQYMIAFMIMGISCFVLRQLTGKWLYALLAGSFLCLAPLFKPTGFSALGAVGLFVIVQPILKHCTWKKTGSDILLLFAGAVIVIGLISLWLVSEKAPARYYPYSSMFRIFAAASEEVSQDDEETVAEEIQENLIQGDIQQDENADESFLLKIMPSYVSDSWRILDAQERKEALVRVFRWYGVLILPVVLALASISVRIIRLAFGLSKKAKSFQPYLPDSFVLLFAVWWLLDMTFVWISPRSYEQYYLPLNASAAMLSGYLIGVYIVRLFKKPAMPATGRTILLDVICMSGWVFIIWLPARKLLRYILEPDIYQVYAQYIVVICASTIMLVHILVAVLLDWLTKQNNKFRWFYLGIVCFLCMIIMSWPIFFGIKTSPHSGLKYTSKQNGYAQRLDEISYRRKNDYKGPWEHVGEYIQDNSEPDDGIYVWGWYPGIYVAAQRLSPAPRAFESGMHTSTPKALSERIEQILDAFEKNPPKFIVDSRKIHYPNDRPPLELWPSISNSIKLLSRLPENEDDYNQFWQIILQIFEPDNAITTEKFLQPDDEVFTKLYEIEYTRELGEFIDPDEALRFETMEPFRRYVMTNYTIVEPGQYFRLNDGRFYHRKFGEHILFKRKESQ